MADAVELAEHIALLGLERALKIYYGIYRATCVDNHDPEFRGRIRIACPEAGHDSIKGLENVWVDPLFEGSGPDIGSFYPPIQGALVRCFFLNGKPESPIGYFGGWYTQTGTKQGCPSEFKYASDGTPQRRGFITRAGHMLIFDDEPGSESVKIIWHKPESGDVALTDFSKAADRTKGKFATFTFDASGSAQLVNANGSMLVLDADEKHVLWVDESGNSVTTDTDGIKLIDFNGNLLSLDAKAGNLNVIVSGDLNFTGKSANFKVGGVFLGDGAPLSAVLGEPLLAWLAAHNHLTGVGPSSPAAAGLVGPPPPAILSLNVKLK
jgi:hypothetical protein